MFKTVKEQAFHRLNELDHHIAERIAHHTKGLSPNEVALAWMDWLSHLAIAPGTQAKLALELSDLTHQVLYYAVAAMKDGEAEPPTPNVEYRMRGEAWQKWPFNAMVQGHQSLKAWWAMAAMAVEGARPEHKAQIFAQIDYILDLISPANHPLCNPTVLQATLAERGQNLLRGARYFLQDTLYKGQAAARQAEFAVGKNLATSPGKVVFKNSLLELIQYDPVTKTVGAEPVLFCPAWIMKYYILDLSPENSMVKYLVSQGKTVFAISWKNPTPEDKNTGFEDYILHGLLAAVHRCREICNGNKVNAVGYCIGGTLLAATAATMAREKDDSLHSITLFAAQTDFTEAGDIRRFVSPSQMHYLDKTMAKQGILASNKMGAAFSAMRASDLIFGTGVDRYLLGKAPPANDLMTWNADGTNMPHKMHTEYLQQLYLDNQLASNQFTVGGDIISLSDIRVPWFVVGTEADHVAPWQSVYKIHNTCRSDISFLLTSSGHNAGIIAGPEHPRRHYRVATRAEGDRFIAPQAWFEQHEPLQGSWWPCWNTWLNEKMTAQQEPPTMGGEGDSHKVLMEAPGSYVFG